MFTDVIAARNQLQAVKNWWEIGSTYGYFTNPAKTGLIVKVSENLKRAQDLFGAAGVKVTSESYRHLVAIIGTTRFR